ncbi:MAG: DUF4134 domain-containing protein [Bergeyella sp.]
MNAKFANVKMKSKKMLNVLSKVFTPDKMLILAFLLLTIDFVYASGGGSALGNAGTTIRGYLTGLKTLIYAIAVIVGIVGGIRIYNKWTNGDQDINKEIVGWGGAAVFLTVVPTFIEAIFPA